MRAWGPVAAIVFAFVLAVVAGSRLDATASAMVVGVVMGVAVTSVVFLVAFAVVASHNGRVREAERARRLHREEVIHGSALARQSKADEVVVA